MGRSALKRSARPSISRTSYFGWSYVCTGLICVLGWRVVWIPSEKAAGRASESGLAGSLKELNGPIPILPFCTPSFLGPTGHGM